MDALKQAFTLKHSSVPNIWLRQDVMDALKQVPVLTELDGASYATENSYADFAGIFN